MRDEKKRGPGSRKPSGPERLTEAKHLLKSKQKDLKSQEAQLLLRFLDDQTPDDVSLSAFEMLWSFIQWLQEKRYFVIQEKTVFCVPFSHLVEKGKLK